MKPIAFLRSAFKRKGKKKLLKTPSPVEPLSLVPPASPLSTSSFTEASSMLSLGFEYPHEDPQITIIDRPATTEIENWEIFSPSTDTDLREEHSSPSLSRSHGSPQNASTAVLNLEGAQYSLQPSMYMCSRPPSPILSSSTLVKFAPESQTRKMHPSSLRQVSRRIRVQKKACVSSDIATDDRGRDSEEIDTSAATSSSEHIFASHALSDSTITTHAIMDTPSSSSMKTILCARSLSPRHLTQMRLDTVSQLQEENFDLSQDTLASFPRPPPLKIKRRPQPLILLPTLATDRLPPSPLLSSTDSTPSITPLSTPRSSKFPNRPLHTVIPPPYSPPNTPLPTPPTSPAFPTSSDRGKLSGARKVMRTIHSTSELRDHWFPVTYPSVSRTPSADVFVSENTSTWCDKSNPAFKSGYSSRETMPSNDPPYEYGLSETRIQWGYAL